MTDGHVRVTRNLTFTSSSPADTASAVRPDKLLIYSDSRKGRWTTQGTVLLTGCLSESYGPNPPCGPGDRTPEGLDHVSDREG